MKKWESRGRGKNGMEIIEIKMYTSLTLGV